MELPTFLVGRLSIYHSAAECMTAKENLSLAVPDTIAKKDRKVYAQMASLATKKAVCISTDDPRLKDEMKAHPAAALALVGLVF